MVAFVQGLIFFPPVQVGRFSDQIRFHVVKNVLFSCWRRFVSAHRSPGGAEHHEELRPPLLWLPAVRPTFRRDGSREPVGSEQRVGGGAVALVQTQSGQQQTGR